jgi:hypothetical protein
MYWDMSLWNYHKLSLMTAIFIFILLYPPVLSYIQRGTNSAIWTAIVIALLMWSFIFIMLHFYSSKNKHTQSADDFTY